MQLFRVFDWDGVSLGRKEGGPLFVLRARQGAGRHDAPARYGAVTQRMATTIFDEGAGGMLWWSVLEVEWTNVTLFHERALPHMSIAIPPRKLSTRMPEVQQAAEHLGIEM